MGDSGDELFKELERTYCPPIDPALFVAIVSDFDLAIPTQVEQLRETLDVLNASAVEQENLPFDPTGTTNLRNFDVSGSLIGESSDDAPSDFTSWPSFEYPEQDNDDPNNASREAQRLKGSKRASTFLGMTTADKAQNLISMFPSITRLEAERILEDCHDNLSRSMDVLLNLAFIEETQIAGEIPQETPQEAAQDSRSSIPKSIDGFQANEDLNGGNKKSRKKKKQQKQRRVELASQAMNNTAPNKWEVGKKDIDFISSRACALQREKIASIYHENSMSLCATIRVLAQAHAPKNIHEIEDDPVLVTQVGELSHKYPGVQPTTLIGLIRISNNQISAADDLADTLSRRPDITSVANIISFVSSPVTLDDEEENMAPAQQMDSASDFMDFNQAAAAANSHFAARSAALAQASQSARRARSTPSMAVPLPTIETSATSNVNWLCVIWQLLLTVWWLANHRILTWIFMAIAREKVQAWWDGLGDQKYVRGGGQSSHGGFNIVCGVGHHSLDRKSHIGPAVWNMLLKEGWRVELNRGSIHQTIPIRLAPTLCSSRFLSSTRKPPHSKASAKVLRAAPTIPFFGAFFSSNHPEKTTDTMSPPDQRSEDQWRAVLSPEQFRILREKGTERPGTGEYDSHYPSKGVYNCAGCDAPLYTADHKFKSGCGWPAYFDSIPGAVTRHVDNTFGMKRTEIVCTNCGGHLGHVFEGEGYQTPTDERHCVNSVSLRFTEDTSAAKNPHYCYWLVTPSYFISNCVTGIFPHPYIQPQP
ncbi:Peptide methionine sulfoxide reductase MrsB [Penicillium fimorum]|uniref:Peptide methionine sulfoxide reductase MrsB n=1 Tax=Penicillium fimorum TaxID=1882269 RepID=A0A9X0C9F6_9EURO|nr:Peptide methionine sulfoxide reductase MrsB [Penicillium fimorum]